MATKLKTSIQLEKDLFDQIYKSMQGDVIQEVIKATRIPSKQNYWKDSLEGHSIKVDEKLLKRFNDLFEEVKSKLGFKEKVDFYITGNSEVNAFAIMAQEEDESHIINVNSALIQLMTDDELKFVIGHELGHLISQDAKLLNLVQFVFEGEAIPVLLMHKIRLWNQLAELVADRYGYMAVEDLNVCISAFFKMSSGLDFAKMGIDFESFIEENKKRLAYFQEEEGLSCDSHPINPIRVEAIHLFSKAKSDKELTKQMDQLINILLKVRSSELDRNLSVFIATAGLIVASCDGNIDTLESNEILNNLSALQIFPIQYIEELSKQDVSKLFEESIAKILEINPTLRDTMLLYIISIIMADNRFEKEEVELLYQIGENLLGYSRKEIAHYFAASIQEGFRPGYDGLR
ncbi:MAG: M48 family metallopeptidase [Paludibacteraceae bacterium]|nr:M48 family metallopeptidase [Paludibacteraceae bacterium]